MLLAAHRPDGVDLCAPGPAANAQCAAPPVSTIFHAAYASAHRGILLEANTSTIVANDQVNPIGNDTALDDSLGSVSVAMDVA